jgi:hypothetical protein
MSYFSIATQVVNLTGTEQIRQGCDDQFVFICENTSGIVPIPTSEWSVRCEFRTNTIKGGGVLTNCPQPVVSILNSGTGGEILLEMPSTQTTAPAHANLVFSGKYDIELVHTSGKVTRPFQGDWAVDQETTGP